KWKISFTQRFAFESKGDGISVVVTACIAKLYRIGCSQHDESIFNLRTLIQVLKIQLEKSIVAVLAVIGPGISPDGSGKIRSIASSATPTNTLVNNSSRVKTTGSSIYMLMQIVVIKYVNFRYAAPNKGSIQKF